MQNLALSRSYYFRSSERKPSKKVLEDQNGKKITSDKFVLQMVVRGDTIEFENDIPIKHNAKNSSFSFFFYTTSTYSRFKNKIHNH